MIWDRHTYLMIDWGNVESESNTSMIREEAFKRRDKLDTSTYCWNSGMMVEDGGTFRVWYHAPGGSKTRLAYSESADGVTFRPAATGVAGDGMDAHLMDLGVPAEPGAWVSGLFHDPLDAEHPFKCVYSRPARGKDIYRPARSRWPAVYRDDAALNHIWGIGRSKDGFAWEPPRHSHSLFPHCLEYPWLHRALDGGLVICGQGDRMSEWPYRGVWGVITYDLETAELIPDYLYHTPQHQSRVYAEFTGPAWDRIPWIQPHVGLSCARKGNAIVALHGYIYGVGGASPTACETYFQKGDVGLAISSTGIAFQDVWPYRPFIPRGERGRWDHGIVVHGPILDLEDETRFYYSASSVGNLTSPDGGCGIAYVPRDRYGHRLIRGFRDVEKRPRTGTVALKPCALPGEPRIAVNVENLDEHKTVRIELRTPEDHVIPGYSFEDCVPVREDGLRRDVRWRNGAGAELGGRPVKICVELASQACGDVHFDSPKIYAVYTG